MNIIKAKKINFGYRKELLLKDFDISINEGEFVGIIGPNGAGKSTILKILSGFLKKKSGEINIAGKNIAEYADFERAKIIGTVPQNIFSSMPYTVKEIVEMGRYSKLSKFSTLSKEDKMQINLSLTDMDIMHLSESIFNNLSGGEKQRTIIAAALAQEPRVLLLDEPTSQLDMGHAVSLMKKLKQLQKNKNLSIVIVSHDIQLLANFVERIILIDDGEVIIDGKPKDILQQELIAEIYNCPIEIIKLENDKFVILAK